MTKSHLISCRRPTRPMPTAYTRTYTRIRIRIHLRTHTNTHVYTPVKCAPPPPPTKAHILLADAPGGCMSVCVCVYCCLSTYIRVYVYLYTHLRSYKNLGIPPILLSNVHGSLLLCEADSNDFVVQSSVEWGMSIYSSLRAISQ